MGTINTVDFFGLAGTTSPAVQASAFSMAPDGGHFMNTSVQPRVVVSVEKRGVGIGPCPDSVSESDEIFLWRGRSSSYQAIRPPAAHRPINNRPPAPTRSSFPAFNLISGHEIHDNVVIIPCKGRSRQLARLRPGADHGRGLVAIEGRDLDRHHVWNRGEPLQKAIEANSIAAG